MAFKAGFDINRYRPKDKELTAYKMRLRGMLSQRVEPEIVVNYLHGIMTNPDTSPELGTKVALEIINRVLGKTITADKVYELEQQQAADKSLADLSNAEIEQQISTLYDELGKRYRVEKALDTLERQRQ